MENQKLEALLNLALEVEEAERLKSGQLGVGFLEDTGRWELIVKYNGDIERLQSNVIQVEELIAGYAIVTLPENLIETFTQLEEVEYVEKPKRLYFSTLQGKQASCIFPVTARDPYLSGKGVLIAVIDSGERVILLSSGAGLWQQNIKIGIAFSTTFDIHVSQHYYLSKAVLKNAY